MRSLLKVQNLKYKDILKDISFEIKDKSFNILIGSNGSGKSTLIKALSGIINYDGEVIFNNNVLSESNKSELLKEIGVFIDSNIFIEDLVLSNLTYKLTNLDETNAKKKAYDISKKLDVEYLLFKNINKLSLSERKIVSIISILLPEPKLIIIDDELDELDNYLKNKIINYIKKLKKTAVILVSNDQKLFDVADNLIIVKEGKIIETGTPEELFKKEQLFNKNGAHIPFNVDLFNKLKFYNLIEKENIYDVSEMVDEVWK